MTIIQSVANALFMAFSLLWEILWPLILGFTLSGVVQVVVSHQTMAKTLGSNGPKSLTFAILFGIASSSCSYAAVALARSIFQKEPVLQRRWSLSLPRPISSLNWVLFSLSCWDGNSRWRNILAAFLWLSSF